MSENIELNSNNIESSQTINTNNSLTTVDSAANMLAIESANIVNQIVEIKDPAKVKDLAELFNLNQKKKTMARINKQSELLDIITDQTLARFTQRPDELSTQDLLQALKTIQDSMDKGYKQVNDTGMDTPLIQINQQTNEVNLGENLQDRESRERVKKAVMNILNNLTDNNLTDPLVGTVDEMKEKNYDK